MKALDTNVLVRFLVRDHEEQFKVVNTMLVDAEADKEVFFVSNVVVLEVMWVLKSAYGAMRDDILLALNELLSMSVLEFQDQPAVRDFVISAQGNSYDLADLLIAQVGEIKGCDTTLTFDKRAAKSPWFTAL